MHYWYSPEEVVVHHGAHGVLHPLLLRPHAGVQVLLQALAQLSDDELGVGDLLPVQLHEGQQAALGAELAVVVHVLERGGGRRRLKRQV